MLVDGIREWLAGICLVGVAVSTAAWVVVAHGRRIAAAMDALHSIPREHLAAFLVFAAIATLSAQKTNSPPVRMMAPPLDMQPPPTVSSTDVARGYRLDCEFTSEAYSYTMPTNGMRYDNWWKRGAYEDVFRLDLGGMAFPFADELLSSLWVYTWRTWRGQLGRRGRMQCCHRRDIYGGEHATMAWWRIVHMADTKCVASQW